MAVRLYFDHNFYGPIIEQLRRRDVLVVTGRGRQLWRRRVVVMMMEASTITIDTDDSPAPLSLLDRYH